MAEINVNKLSVKDYLQTGAKKKFLIPEYQRPYSWGEDEVRTLWEDIVTYFSENNDKDYFCGTIVTYKNDEQENEIIDGQQRTTTLLLLLRAIYNKAEKVERETPETLYLKTTIEPCLWKVGKTTGIPDKNEILINSKVASDKHNEEFLNILKTGNVTNTESKYAENYNLLKLLVDEQASKEPITWYALCNDILERVILLPIECEDQETALTIFSTLNDRGMTLNDADIFKAKIYNYLDNVEKRNDFIENWKFLEEQTKESNIEIQTILYYYMFYLRALEGDTSTTTPGLRKYFAKDKFNKLYSETLINDLKEIANLWEIINNNIEKEEYSFSKNIDIKKAFDILKQYSNEYWKYSITNYFLANKNKNEFNEKFKKFLYRLIAYIMARLTINPTLNAVKTDFLYLNRDVLTDMEPDFYKEFTNNDKKDLEDSLLNRVRVYHKATRPLLYILAYSDNKQTELFKGKIEIEHILPRQWTQSSLFGYNKDEVEDEIESLGNKIVLDKLTNIKAGNNSFATKKEKYYANSTIASVKEICNIYINNDFKPDDIRDRNIKIKDKILKVFEEWGLFNSKEKSVKATEEELKQIEVFRQRGLIN